MSCDARPFCSRARKRDRGRRDTTHVSFSTPPPKEALKRPKTPEPHPISKRCEFCCEINRLPPQHMDFTPCKAICYGFNLVTRCEHVIHTFADIYVKLFHICAKLSGRNDSTCASQ